MILNCHPKIIWDDRQSPKFCLSKWLIDWSAHRDFWTLVPILCNIGKNSLKMRTPEPSLSLFHCFEDKRDTMHRSIYKKTTNHCKNAKNYYCGDQFWLSLDGNIWILYKIYPILEDLYIYGSNLSINLTIL